MNPLIEFTKWLLKWTGIVLLGLIVLAVVIGGGAWAWNWYSYDRHVAKIQPVVTRKGASPSKVVADTKPVEELCNDDYPIFVGFTNGSSQTVEYVQIDVTARLPGHSTNILRYDSNLKMDRIVEPGGGFGQCARFQVDEAYKADPKVAQGIYTGTVYYVRFAKP